MTSVFTILNHQISQQQETQLRQDFGIDKVFKMPEELQKIWIAVPPSGENISRILIPIAYWLKSEAKNGDFALVQGEFGATYYMVDFCFHCGLTPIYASSDRVYDEEILKDGTVLRTHAFRHVKFRYYERWPGE